AEKRPTLEAAFKYELLQSYNEFEGLRAELTEVSANYLFYPLFLDVLEGKEDLEIQFSYQTDQFSGAMVTMWLQSYRGILEAITRNPNALVSEIGSTLTDLQWQKLAGWNETRTDYPGDRTVVRLFEEVVEKQPNAVALKWDGGKKTYRELQNQSSLVAQYLSARGVSEGDRIGLFLDRSPERLAAILGIVKLGAAYVPIDPEYPAERLDLILEDSESTVVISQESLSARLPERAQTVFEIQEVLRGDAKAPIPETFSGDSSQTALCIMYTSGSTGTPKGAVYAHRGMIRAIRNINYCDLNPDETILHTSSICFDVSTFEMFGALLNGATLVIPPAEPLSLGTITDCISRHRVTTLWLTSGLFQLMVEEELHAFQGVSQLLTGGDIVPVTHARALKEAYPNLRLINCYGPTENTTYTTAHTVTKADLSLQALPVGAPINNSSAWILDENQKPLPPGMAGELYCGGDGVCLGYLNQPELTADRFVKVQLHPDRYAERLYRTGDLCRFRADGTIDFIGRMDHQVKIRGFRVEPGEIETCLSANPHVGQCKVITVGETATEKSLVAYVSPLNGYRPTPEELREYSHRRLPSYMVPASVVVLDDLPVNTNGKIDTKALPAPGTEATIEASSSPAVADKIEDRLKVLWEKTLKVESMGVDEDFFSLGGHSLLGMKLFSQIQREFDLSLPLSVLFKYPTVGLLAREISRRLEGDSLEPSVPALSRKEAPSTRRAPKTTRTVSSQYEAKTSTPVVQTPPQALAETTVLLKPEGSKTALFGIHGGDGGVFFYRNLAARLDTDRPFYAFEADNLTGTGEILFESVEETAARYVSELRRVQRDGPYFLCGYSFGGIVAFEMACQLQKAGAKIGFLGIIDANNPASEIRQRRVTERVAINWNGTEDSRSGVLHKVARLGHRIRSGLGYRIKGDAQWIAAKTLPSSRKTGWLRLAQVRRANTLAQEKYTNPSLFRGEISLFRAMEGNDKYDWGETYGWEETVKGSIRTFDVPGNHITLFDEENIDHIASALKEALDHKASPF
ncbi:MAG: amino acid adenylation domain-containing protein, partial [Verrucomicrobiota bacterium]